MVKVFISYAHEDEEFARRFYHELKSINDIEPWLDKECLQPGMKWRPAIRKAIREADFFVALLSTRTGTRRGFVNTELNSALEIRKEFPEGHIYLIPVRLDDCNMLVDELTEIQYVDLFPDWSTGMEKVLRSIGTKLPSHPQKIENKPIKSNVGYQYRVGIVDLDLGLTNLMEIAQHLNSIQNYYHFVCPKMQPVKDVVQRIGGSPNFVLDLVPPSFYAEHEYLGVDLVATLTKYPLAFHGPGGLSYNYFASPSSIDERFMFLSTSQIYSYAKNAGRTYEKGIVHLILAQLVVYFTDVGYHSTTRGCLMDFCGNRADIVEGLKSKMICSLCEPRIQNSEFKNALIKMLADDVIL